MGLMSEFKINKVYVPSLNTWEEPGDTLKSRLGEINYFQQGDMAVCYIEYGEVGKPLPIIKKDENGEPIIDEETGDYVYETTNLKIYTDQMIGVINQKTTNKEFFVQSSLSQNTTNTYKNLSLYNLLNNIGENETNAIDTPQMKGIFIPTHDDGNNIHALYEGRFNKDSNKTDDVGDLYLVKTNVENIKTNGGYISHNTSTTNPNFNVYYNTNIYGKTILDSGLTVNSTTTLNSGLEVNGVTTLYSTLNVGTTGGNISTNLNGPLTVGTASNQKTTTLNGTLNVQGATEITDSTASSSTDTGALTVTGGVGIGGAVNISGSVTASVNNIGGVSLGVPVGSIVMWPIATVPAGWMSMSENYKLGTNWTGYISSIRQLSCCWCQLESS